MFVFYFTLMHTRQAMNTHKQNPLEKYLVTVNAPGVNALWDMWKKGCRMIWSADIIDLSQDVLDWKEKLTDDERHFILSVLGFFVASDGPVAENVALNFYNAVNLPEARSFYAYQLFIEHVHAETYTKLIDALVRDAVERERVRHSAHLQKYIAKKTQWALDWLHSQPGVTFAAKIFAFAVVEGLFFSGSFCSIFWLKKRGLMPGLCASNELISRDEGLHCDFACLLYKTLNLKLTRGKMLEILTSACEREVEFITDALPHDLVGMNAKLMRQYIEYVADDILIKFGEDPHYGSTNPFPWMARIGLDGKTNTFEKQTTEYSFSPAEETNPQDVDLSFINPLELLRQQN